MSKAIKKIALTVICCLLIMVILSGCSGLNPIYNRGIRIKIAERQAQILIQEQQFLLGSTAKIYYIEGNEYVLLGTILAGDNGFCPFEKGLYSTKVKDDKLTIEWCDKGSNAHDRSKWKTQTYDLPAI